MKIGVIEIEQMEFYAFHGCYKEEKVVGNRFLVDLTFEVDVEKAAKSDSIYDTVSYLDVYQTVKEQVMIKSDILENVADRILVELRKNFPDILSAKVKVSKCAPPLGGAIKQVSVTMGFVK